MSRLTDPLIDNRKADSRMSNLKAARGSRFENWARFWQVLVTLVERKILIYSKRSWFGMAWPLVSPVLLFGLYLFIFHTVLHVNVHDYAIYLFAGLLPWTFVAQTLPDAIVSLTSEADIVRRSFFFQALLPIASVVALFVYFVVTLTIFIIVLLSLGYLNPVVLPAIVIPTACLLLLVSCLGMLLALLDVYNHDLRRYLANLLTAWFFLLPIVYRPHQVKLLNPLRYLDPVNILVSEFRAILYYGTLPPAHTLASGLAICIGLFSASLLLYRRFRDRLPREL